MFSTKLNKQIETEILNIKIQKRLNFAFKKQKLFIREKNEIVIVIHYILFF